MDAGDHGVTKSVVSIRPNQSLRGANRRADLVARYCRSASHKGEPGTDDRGRFGLGADAELIIKNELSDADGCISCDSSIPQTVKVRRI